MLVLVAIGTELTALPGLDIHCLTDQYDHYTIDALMDLSEHVLAVHTDMIETANHISFAPVATNTSIVKVAVPVRRLPL